MWWLSQHKLVIPHRLTFTTENNPIGYDWFWGVTDNNWSILYGNAMFWLSEGPAFGLLTVTPDGKNFYDFCNVKFHYNNLVYVKEYDFYYPSDIEITGILDDKKINLRIWGTTESYDYIYPHENSEYYKALTLFEIPGRMKGTYKDDKKTLPLEGDCKIVQQRQPSVLGHNSLKLYFLKPPKGVGLDIDFNSHFLKKRINSRIQFAPRPCIGFHFKKLKKRDFPPFKT